MGLARAVSGQHRAGRSLGDPAACPETPAFLEHSGGRRSRAPIFEVLRTHGREVLLAMGVRMAENGAFYMYTVFVLVYGTRHSDWSAGPRRRRCSAAPPACWSRSRFRRAVGSGGMASGYLFGACVTDVFAYPLLRLLDTGSPALACLALIVALVFGRCPM